MSRKALRTLLAVYATSFIAGCIYGFIKEYNKIKLEMKYLRDYEIKEPVHA